MLKIGMNYRECENIAGIYVALQVLRMGPYMGRPEGLRPG